MPKPLLHNLTLERWQLIKQAACVLEVPAEHLAAVIAFETGEAFSPHVSNPFSRAIGLIQFTPVGYESIKGRGYSYRDIGVMTFEEQLFGPVVDYLMANKAVGRKELADLYMAVLAPRFVSRPMDSVLYRAPNKSYTQNKGLDDAGKGYITKADAAQEVLKKLKKVIYTVKQLEKGVI